MKEFITYAILTSALAGFVPQSAPAQGTLYLSGLGSTPTGSSPVGSDSWMAADFRTGTNAGGYQLNSIQLALGDAAGNPGGFTVMLATNAGPTGLSPGGSVGTLNGSLDPVTAGIYTYSPASALTLSPRTPYWVVLTSGTAITNGAYAWSFTSTYPAVSLWFQDSVILSYSGSLYWLPYAASYAQFGIYATALPVPEPSALGLFVLGGFLLVRHRRKPKAIYEKNNH